MSEENKMSVGEKDLRVGSFEEIFHIEEKRQT